MGFLDDETPKKLTPPLQIKNLVKMWHDQQLHVSNTARLSKELRMEGHNLSKDDLNKLRQLFAKIGTKAIPSTVKELVSIFARMDETPLEYGIINQDITTKINNRVNAEISMTCLRKLRKLLDDKIICI